MNKKKLAVQYSLLEAAIKQASKAKGMIKRTTTHKVHSLKQMGASFIPSPCSKIRLCTCLWFVKLLGNLVFGVYIQYT
jgi:hypothetical protein